MSLAGRFQSTNVSQELARVAIKPDRVAEGDAAARRSLEAGDRAQERGLAAAARAEDGGHAEIVELLLHFKGEVGELDARVQDERAGVLPGPGDRVSRHDRRHRIRRRRRQ